MKKHQGHTSTGRQEVRQAGRDLDGGGAVFLAEQLSIASVPLTTLRICTHLVTSRTEMIEKMDTRAGYPAQVEVKKRRAWAGTTKTTAKAWISSGLLDSVKSSALDDSRKAVKEGESGGSTAGARVGGVSVLGKVAPTWVFFFGRMVAKRRGTEESSAVGEPEKAGLGSHDSSHGVAETFLLVSKQ